MENKISDNTVIFFLLVAVLFITAAFFPSTSLNFSLITTILFCYGYFLLIAKVYKSLKSKKILKYSLVIVLVLLFLPYFIVTVFISNNAAIKIRLHGLKSQLTGFPLPPDSKIIDSECGTNYPGASDSRRGFEAFITLKTSQPLKALEYHYDVSQFSRAGPEHGRDDIHPYIGIKRVSAETVIIELADTQSNTSFFSF